MIRCNVMRAKLRGQSEGVIHCKSQASNFNSISSLSGHDAVY